MRRRSAVLTILLTGALSAALALTLVWPPYSWDLKVPSPDGRYDLVVLRGDAAGFADFSYRFYLFPVQDSPADRTRGTPVLLTPMWQRSKYLVYSGFNYPEFRWTGLRSIEIDIGDLAPGPFSFDPVKTFGPSNETLVVGLGFGTSNPQNIRP